MNQRHLVRSICLFCVLASPAVVHAAAVVQDVSPIINQTERAFAEASLEKGITPSFLQFIDPEGVIFRPGPVRGVDVLAKDQDTPGISLDWWPVFSGAARSGELGFSTGPWVIHRDRDGFERYGYYVTIWKKQADGSWRFALDGAGARIDTKPTRVKGTPVLRLPLATADGPRSVEAFAEVRQTEDALDLAAHENVAHGYGRYLTDDAWVMGSGLEVVPGKAGWMAELMRRPTKIDYRHIGGGASASGDLAYTYGSATQVDSGEPLDAHYLRIWQRRGQGWKIVVDGLSPNNR